MEFTLLNKFLTNSIELSTIEGFRYQHADGKTTEIGYGQLIDYKEVHKCVIEEVYHNLYSMQPQSVPIYFHEISKRFEDYDNNKDWRFTPSIREQEILKDILFQFNHLVEENQDCEELMNIYYEGFTKVWMKQNDKIRLTLIDKLKTEIKGIEAIYYGKEKRDSSEETAENLETKDKKQKKVEPDKLTSKQQILLLNELGIFDLPILNNLTIEKQGKLFSYLLNRNEKNTTEHIRNRDTPKNVVSKDANFVKTPENINKVSELLKEVGLEKL